MIGDFGVVVNGVLGPVVMKTGDSIDLEAVEVGKYVASVRRGILASMLAGGSLVKVMAEVSEKRYDELRNEFARVKAPVQDSIYAHVTQVIMLEPGMQVSVSGMPPANPAIPAVSLIDAPVLVPGFGSEVAPLSTQAGAQAAEVDGVGSADVVEVVTWKSGLTLAQQEGFIKASVDKEFLAAVIADAEETKKTQRLAKARLAELD